MSDFKQLLEQVSSNAGSSEPNWGAVMEMVENVKTKTVSSKKASTELRKKLLEAATETVAVNLLIVVDSIVKNTPSSLHKDFLTQELLTTIKSIITDQGPKMPRAVDKALEMIGEWRVAFGEEQAYKHVHSIYSALELNGFIIPEVHLASASYMQKPPAFAETKSCFFCAKDFGRFTRRHHCRNCGKSICSSCTAEDSIALPHIGLDSPQRVCMMCFKKLDKPDSDSTNPDHQHDPLPAEYQRMYGQSPTPAPTSTSNTTQDQEEDDLQLAIAMSLNEQENKKPSPRSSPAPPSSRSRPTATPETKPSAPPSIYATLNTELSAPVPSTSAPPAAPVVHAAPVVVPSNTDKQDSELDRYLNRAHWERKAGGGAPGGGAPATTATVQQQEVPNPLVSMLTNLLEQFIQRMQEINGQGLSIATDRVVLSMHQDLTAMHVQLLKQIDEAQQKKAAQESVLHKLVEAKEARVTLDTMRRRHQDQLLQQQREQEALAQMQVQMKLALLRQQKAEQMAYGQTMQQERLGRLTTQRAEYERQLAAQRDQQRQLLIQQEEQVFQQQFGAGVTTVPPSISIAGGGAPSDRPYTSMGQPPLSTSGYSISDQSQALPLPTKPPVEYAPTPPPPYQPPSLNTAAPASLYQPPSMEPMTTSYQPLPNPAAMPPQSYAPPQQQSYLPQSTMPPQLQQHQPYTIQAPPTDQYSMQQAPPTDQYSMQQAPPTDQYSMQPGPPTVAAPLYQPVQHAGPLPHAATPPTMHRRPSSPPLISFD